MEEYIDEIVEKHFEDVNVTGLREQLLQHFLVDFKVEPEEFEKLGRDGLKSKIVDACLLYTSPSPRDS